MVDDHIQWCIKGFVDSTLIGTKEAVASYMRGLCKRHQEIITTMAKVKVAKAKLRRLIIAEGHRWVETLDGLKIFAPDLEDASQWET